MCIAQHCRALGQIRVFLSLFAVPETRHDGYFLFHLIDVDLYFHDELDVNNFAGTAKTIILERKERTSEAVGDGVAA